VKKAFLRRIKGIEAVRDICLTFTLGTALLYRGTDDKPKALKQSIGGGGVNRQKELTRCI